MTWAFDDDKVMLGIPNCLNPYRIFQPKIGAIPVSPIYIP
jgi:hypothetical protein